MEHKHLLLMFDCKRPPISDSMLENWVSTLIERLGMTPLIDPKAVRCDLEGNEGLTCISAIQTSHIVLHSWDNCYPAKIQLDIYTCSDINLPLVWHLIDSFSPFNTRWKFYDRSNGFNSLDQSEQSRIEKNLLKNYWHFAKTMPKIPHWYTRAREWDNVYEFAEAVDLIKKNGVIERFGNQEYSYLYLGDHKYWTMENDDVPSSEHILINRAEI